MVNRVIGDLHRYSAREQAYENLPMRFHGRRKDHRSTVPRDGRRLFDAWKVRQPAEALYLRRGGWLASPGEVADRRCASGGNDHERDERARAPPDRSRMLRCCVQRCVRQCLQVKDEIANTLES